MEIRSWTPEQPLGRSESLKNIDATIVQRITRPKSGEGDRPAAIDEALTHCTRQFQLRELDREVLEIARPALEPIPGLREGDPAFAPVRPRTPILSREVGTTATASRIADRSLRAVRALRRVLLNQPYRGGH